MARQRLDGEYDPANFYTVSQDHHGHSSWSRVPMPKHWHGQIQALVHSREWPEYTSVQAFVRDAIYHRLHWVDLLDEREHDPRLGAVLAQAEIDILLRPWTEDNEQYRAIEKSLDAAGEMAIANRDADAFSRITHQIEDSIRTYLRPPFDQRLLEKLENWRKRAASIF